MTSTASDVTLKIINGWWTAIYPADSDVAAVMGTRFVSTAFGAPMTFDEVCDALDAIPANAGTFWVEA